MLFQLYLETQLAPTLSESDIVILDNLGSHKGTAARMAFTGAGARLWFLPPFSPDLNLNEMVFAKLKHWLRNAAERTAEASWRRIGALDRISPEECRRYLTHCGNASA